MKKLEKAIAYFENAIKESDEIISECSQELQKELTEQKGHFEVALEAMRKNVPAKYVKAGVHGVEEAEILLEISNRLAAYEDSGLSPEEVQELAKAKAEKRLVVLPCRVGDTVYVIADCADVLKIYDNDYFGGTGAVECPFEKDCPFDECNDDNKRVFATSFKGFWIDDDGRLSMYLDYINADAESLDFGKTVFLSKEAAENALGGKDVDKG